MAQQNGVSEKKNPHIIKKARCLLIQVGVPLPYWVDAVCTIVLLINRLPTPTLQNSSLYAKLCN